MNILLHTCCANCALYPVSYLRDRGERVTGYWFNPNIHPFLEYRNRLNSVRKMEDILGLQMLYQDTYGLIPFVRAIAGKENQRCRVCYFLRLEETARKSVAEGFDAFSTTLLISPYQDQELLRDTGNFLARRYNVEFLFQDFREGFREAQKRAAGLGLYQQKYCGCIYSEAERYQKVRKPGRSNAPLPGRITFSG